MIRTSLKFAGGATGASFISAWWYRPIPDFGDGPDRSKDTLISSKSLSDR